MAPCLRREVADDGGSTVREQREESWCWSCFLCIQFRGFSAFWDTSHVEGLFPQFSLSQNVPRAFMLYSKSSHENKLLQDPMQCTPPQCWNAQVLECDRQAFDSWAVLPVCTVIVTINVVWDQPLISATLLCSYLVFAPPYTCKPCFLCALLFQTFAYFIYLCILSEKWILLMPIAWASLVKELKHCLKNFPYMADRQVWSGIYAVWWR